MSTMIASEFEALLRFVSDRYERSGQPPDVVKALNEHNYRVISHVEEISEGEGLNEADFALLKTIAVLHDAAKADTHLMLHADAGAEVAVEKLREMGKSEDFIEAVDKAIRCHMGPFPFIEEETKKYAERTGEHLHHPRPESRMEQLFYDADMLALMDIEGIEKVVVLRSTSPEFIEEDERTAGAEGGTPRAAAYRSAFQSVERAANSLHSKTARKIAERLKNEARVHIDTQLAAEPADAS